MDQEQQLIVKASTNKLTPDVKFSTQKHKRVESSVCGRWGVDFKEDRN